MRDDKRINIKVIVKNTMGIISTGLAIVIIYLVLWTTGRIDPLSAETIIEFCVVFGLTIYTKIFWYKDSEMKVREDQDYLDNKNVVLDAIEAVTDIEDFDAFIDDLNIQNSNTVISNHCKLLTPKNYKLRLGDRFFLVWVWLFNHKLYKEIKKNKKLFFFNAYCYKIENDASKIHKLSSSRILTMSRQSLLDDRNFATRNKNKYIILGSILSFLIVLALAPLAFDSKQDVDVLATIIKMLIYLLSIFFNIIFTVFNATAETLNSDLEYFRRLLNILDRYNAYKINPVKHTKISYAKEDDNANTSNNTREEIATDSDDTLGGLDSTSTNKCE